MKLLAYTIIDGVDGGVGHGEQLERIHAWCIRSGDRLVGVHADDGAAAALPLSLRRGGGAVVRQLLDGSADAAVTLRLDRVFPRAGQRLAQLPTLLHHVGLAVHCLDASTIVATEHAGPEAFPASAPRDGIDAPPHSAPFGCHWHAGALYRDPWRWPVREQIVALRVDIGFSFGMVARLLRRLGLGSPDGNPDWPLPLLREIVVDHDRVARLARRDPMLGSAVRDAVPVYAVRRRHMHEPRADRRDA